MTVSSNPSANVNLRPFAYLIYLPRLTPLIMTFFSFVFQTGLAFLILPTSGLGHISLLVLSQCLFLILHLILFDFFMVFLKAQCLVLCCSPSTPLLSLILLPLTHLYLTICMLMTLSFYADDTLFLFLRTIIKCHKISSNPVRTLVWHYK